MTYARSSRAMIFQRGTQTIAGHIMTVVFIGTVVNGEHCISRLGLFRWHRKENACLWSSACTVWL